MNFIPASFVKKDGNQIELRIFGKQAVFMAKETPAELGHDLILGVRPEFLPIREGGPIEGRIYSTLPTGMETTVQVTCDGTRMTGVVFGSVDFPIDSKVNLDLTGDALVLFDKESGKSVAFGSAKIL